MSDEQILYMALKALITGDAELIKEVIEIIKIRLEE